MQNPLKLLLSVFATVLAMLSNVQAIAQETIKVGFIAPMSGVFATYGQSFHNAMQAYIQTHGDTVAGKKIELVIRDNSTNTPENAKRLAQELVSREKVNFLTGFGLTPDALAVVPISTQAKVPTIIMLAGTYGLTLKSPYMSRISFTLTQVTVPMAQWALKNKIKKVYTVVSDFAPGIDSEEAFKKTFMAGGGEIIGGVRVPLANTDYSAFVQRIKDANPDAVFLFMPPGEPTTQFMKSYVERGLHKAGMRVMTSMDIAEEFIQPMGDAALNIVNSVNYYESIKNEENTRFLNTYRKISGGKYPGAIALGGYDGMATIYEVTRKLSGKINDGAKVMDALKGMKLKSPRGEFMIDPETRDVVQNVYIAKIEKQGGRLVPVIMDTFPNVKDTPPR